MARNIGETMGTGAKYALLDRYGNPLPAGPALPLLGAPRQPAHDRADAAASCSRRRGTKTCSDRSIARRPRAARSSSTSTASQCHGPHIAPPAHQGAQLAAQGARPIRVDREDAVRRRHRHRSEHGAELLRRAEVDLTKTGLTADDLRAGRAQELTRLEPSAQTRACNAEIARLKATIPATTPRRSPPCEKQLAGLDAAMAQAAVGDRSRRASRSARGLSYLGMLIREKAYADLGLTPAQQDDMGRLRHASTCRRWSPSYKPRPLAGMWATAPFLHNGSVPTIYDLLVAGRRAARRRSASAAAKYDTVKAGTEAARQRLLGVRHVDTTGNHNTGHEFNTRLQGVEGRRSARARPDRPAAVARRAARRSSSTSRCATTTSTVRRSRTCRAPPGVRSPRAATQGIVTCGERRGARCVRCEVARREVRGARCEARGARREARRREARGAVRARGARCEARGARRRRPGAPARRSGRVRADFRVRSRSCRRRGACRRPG